MAVYNDRDGKKVRLKKDGTPDRRSPPKEHQFKPGQSGCAKGRPKRRKSPAEMLDDAAQEQIRVDGKPITFDQLASKQLVRQAGNGDLKAIALMHTLRMSLHAGSAFETPEERAAKESANREFSEFLHSMFEPLKPFEASGLCHWNGEFKATIPKWIVEECWRRYDRETRTFDHGDRVPVSDLPKLGGSMF